MHCFLDHACWGAARLIRAIRGTRVDRMCVPLAGSVFVSVGPFDDRGGRDDLVWLLPDTCLAATVTASALPCSARQASPFVDLALWRDATTAKRWTLYPMVHQDDGVCIGTLIVGLPGPFVPGWAPPDAQLLDVSR